MEERNNLQVVVYSPESLIRTPRTLIKAMLSDLRGSRELAWRLASRDISAQYRQAFLGFLWALILPLANTAAWIFLSTSGVVSFGTTALPYPLFVFTGTMLWAIFMDALNAPLQQANAARPMLSKLNFPREALLLSGIYQTLFNALIKIIMLVGTLLFMGIHPGWGLLLFPFGVLSLILAGTALGLLVTPTGMLYTDVGKAIPLLMQFFMFITPVAFPAPKSGWASTLFALNPLTPLIVNSRNWLTGHATEYPLQFFAVCASSFCLLLLVWLIYRIAMPVLIERMSA